MEKSTDMRYAVLNADIDQLIAPKCPITNKCYTVGDADVSQLIAKDAERRSRPGVKLTLGEGNEEGIDSLQRSV